MIYKNQYLRRAKGLVAAAVVATTMGACQQDLIEPQVITDEDAQMETDPRAIYSSRSVYFTRPNGSYSASAAAADMGDIYGWDVGSTYISSNTLRITLAANVVGTSGGMESQVDISDGTEYSMEFKIRFHSAFDFSRGGKSGWGFLVGNGVTGCRSSDAQAGQGGSLRTMWYSPGSDPNRVFFQPYVYHQGMTANCGETWNAKYPSSGALSRGTWYTIRLYYKANTGSSYNGIAEMRVNNNLVLRRTDIRWASSDANRKVKRLYFSVFRGGSSSDWASGSVGYVYFDDLSWNRISS